MPGLYFVSDIHLGLQEPQAERLKLERLESLFSLIRNDGGALYLVGDILDYWMEYRHVIPKGFTRFICLLSELAGSGVQVSYLAGNHDFHLGRYFDDELGVRTLYGLQEVRHDGKLFLVAHGDGLGEGDLGYRFFARYIRNSFNLGLLTAFHPDLATGLMMRLSRLSRNHKPADTKYEPKRLVEFAASLARERVFDYFVCGHNHTGRMERLDSSGATYVNLGTWIEGQYPYGVYDNGEFQIRKV